MSKEELEELIKYLEELPKREHEPDVMEWMSIAETCLKLALIIKKDPRWDY